MTSHHVCVSLFLLATLAIRYDNVCLYICLSVCLSVWRPILSLWRRSVPWRNQTHQRAPAYACVLQPKLSRTRRQQEHTHLRPTIRVLV